ncbi:unnamed protein product [Prorocentrum cordatum]|uniref:Acyltransferase n=1 Tax=Prorocentrum cordatum TaxID=2364126 RepID=A0ABN9TAI8_9DINO|nr:unnamed protein product [Polarella glacialis]
MPLRSGCPKYVSHPLVSPGLGPTGLHRSILLEKCSRRMGSRALVVIFHEAACFRYFGSQGLVTSPILAVPILGLGFDVWRRAVEPRYPYTWFHSVIDWLRGRCRAQATRCLLLRTVFSSKFGIWSSY